MGKVLIIGGRGYIGSQLCNNLDYDIQTVDLNLFETTENFLVNYTIDYNKLDSNFYKQFESIVLLAGHSSVRMCDLYPDAVFNNNVRNFVSLLGKLNENQTLIYAGSGSVYGDCKIENATEDYQFESPYNMYDLTKQMIDSYVITSKPKARVFGLRFGTVNGLSPVLRTDVMLNAMTNSAKTQNKVVLFNPETKRSILGTLDLTRAIDTIIKSNKSSGGIYNLCSFTKTSGEMAKIVSDLCQVTLETVVPDEVNKTGLNEKLVSSKYNFALSTDKFVSDFGFKFEETADSIVDGLLMNWEYMIKGHRNTSFNYENQ